MNAAEWEAAARPLVDDLAAVLAEHARMEFGPVGLGPDLHARFTDASARRDLPAFRAACEVIKREAARRAAMYARAEGRLP